MPLFGRDEEKEGWVSRFIDEIKSFFKLGFQAIWEDFTNVVPKAIKKTLGALDDLWKEWGDEQWRLMLKTHKRHGLIDDDDIAEIIEGRKPFGLLWPLYYMIIVLVLTVSNWKVKMGAMTGTIRQNMNVRYSPNPPSPADMVRAGFIAPEKINEVVEAMRRAGLSEKDIDLTFLANYSVYPMEIVRTAWLRGELTDDKMYERMREIGFTDTRIKEIVATWPVIPGVQDILYMVAKEAFEPDIIKHIGLADEFPGEQSEWMKKQGLSDFWTKKYWYAHWDTPSVGQVYEMLHRGVINEYEMDIAFRNAEVPPFWRDKLKDVAFNVYSRVDTRRMHDMGVLDDDELIKAYKDQGYNQERAEKMAEFTIRYNAEKEKELSMGQVKNAYRARAISRDEALALLIKVGYIKVKAEWLLAYEDLDFELDLQKKIQKNIEDRYTNNLINKNDTISRLNKLNITDREIQVMVDSWDIDKYEDKKLHSKADLGKLYIQKIIDEDEYRSDMRRIGYTFRQVDNYLDYMKKTKKQI